MVRGLDWELEGKGTEGKVMVKMKKKGENYHDRNAVLYLGFTLTVLVGRQSAYQTSAPFTLEKATVRSAE